MTWLDINHRRSRHQHHHTISVVPFLLKPYFLNIHVGGTTLAIMSSIVDDDIAQYIRRSGGSRQRLARLAATPTKQSATASMMGMSWASSSMDATVCLELARRVRVDHPGDKCHPVVSDLAGRSTRTSTSHNQSRTMKRFCRRNRSLFAISDVAVKIWDAKARPKPK